jgi:hypothetical protein
MDVFGGWHHERQFAKKAEPVIHRDPCQAAI